jgi:hypothetical protein
MSNGEKTFIKVTNKDIYDKLEALEVKVSKYCDSNEASLAGICQKNEVAHTKIWGRISLQQWMILAALTIASTAIIWIWELASV